MSSISETSDPARLKGNTLEESSEEVTRANLYYLLARTFSSPLEMDNEQPGQLRLLAPELPKVLQEPALSVAKHWEEALDDREALSLAYARLFLGPFEILSSPYASFYLEPDQRLMGEVSRHVARVYSEVWLGPGSGPHEAPDHVALEWEFMYYLTFQYVTTGEARWLERRQSFHIDHLNHWIPELSKAILKANEHSFYDALALLSVTALNQ